MVTLADINVQREQLHHMVDRAFGESPAAVYESENYREMMSMSVELDEMINQYQKGM